MATLGATPGNSILDVLPTEIITMICGHLEEGDGPYFSPIRQHMFYEKTLPRDALCNFRMASKDCAAATTSSLFQHLHIMYTQKSFQNLVDISKSAHLAKHVKSISYEPRMLSVVNKTDYCGSVRLGAYVAGQPMPSDITIKQGYETYLSLVGEQQYIRKTSWDTAIFTLSIPRFTHLTAITINTENGPSYRAKQWLLPAFDWGCELYASPYDPLTMREQYKPINAVITATALSDVKPSSLHICLAPAHFLLSLNAFRHLRHLSLTLAVYPKRERHESIEGLKNLLESASGLESLSVGHPILSGPIGTKYDSLGVWDKVIAELTFPNLRRLELSALSGRPDSFMTFFERHARTLKHVALVSMRIVPDKVDWPDVLEVLRNLNLESAWFWGIWEGSFDENEHLRYFSRMYRELDGLPAHIWLERSVLESAPVFREQVCTIIEVWTTIVQDDPKHMTSDDEGDEDSEGEDDESEDEDDESEDEDDETDSEDASSIGGLIFT
ncbi:hypothetical protein ACMFMF_002274 [Clarireedia jacksonii]